MPSEQREYITFRLGITKEQAVKIIASQNDMVTQKPRTQDDASFYVYLGDHLLDLTTLGDSTHAIKLPIGSQTNKSDKITCKIGTTMRMRRQTYARCTTTVGQLMEATNDHYYTGWMALDESGKALATQLNRAGADNNKAMSVLVFQGTEPEAESEYEKISKDKRIVSKRDIYYDAKANAHDKNPIEDARAKGWYFGDGCNRQTEHLQHIYKKISPYFRIDKDIMYKLQQLVSMATHSDWMRLLKLLRAWQKKFEIGCDEHAITWRDHRYELNLKIRHYQDRLDIFINLKDQIYDNYGKTQKSIKNTNDDTIAFSNRVNNESDVSTRNKEQLSRIEGSHRDTENQNAQIQAKRDYIDACNNGEYTLQKHRHAICLDMLNSAIADCQDQITFLKNRNQTLQNHVKQIKTSSAQQLDLNNVAPAKYNEVKKDVKENSTKHMADAQQNNDELKALKAENNKLMSESLDKNKQLDDVKKAMEGLQEQEERLRKQWLQGLADTKARLKQLQKSCNDALDDCREVNAESARVKASYDGELKRQKLNELNKSMFDASDFLSRRAQLSKDIDDIKTATQNLELESHNVKNNWIKYYKKAYKDLEQRCELNDNAWVNEEIENCKQATAQALDNSIIQEIAELKKKLDSIPAASMGGDELRRTIEDAKDQLTEMRKRMNEKIVCYDDIICQSKILIEVNQQCCENENEKMMLETEIDASIVEAEYKRQLVQELRQKLDKVKRRYTQLKDQISEQDEYLFELRDRINEKDQQIEDNEEVLAQKEKEISDLEAMTGLKAQYGPGAKTEYKFEKKKYKPTKGDVVDELLARILNETDCPIPVRKLGPSKYMFGTDIISMTAKVNSLLVRVGGGYMDFREYLIHHAPKQVTTINQLISNDEWNEEQMFQILLGKLNPHIAQQRGTIAVPKVGKGAMRDATGVSRDGNSSFASQSSPQNSGRASLPGSSRSSIGGAKKKK